MKALFTVGRLYRRLDALLRQLLPERVHLWFKGMCVTAARKLLPARLGKSEGMPSILPAWAYDAVCEAAMDEPELSPELFVPYLRRSPIPIGSSQLGAGYACLWEQIDQHARHVFVLGDADGQIPDFLSGGIKRLATERSGHVLVVWTGSSSAVVFDDLPAQVQLLDLQEVSGIHRATEQAIILARALIEIKPATIHIASSDAAWAMFRTVAAALSECSHLYAEIVPIGPRSAGTSANELERSIASGLPKSIRLIANSTKIIEQWVARYGIDPAMASLAPDADSATAGPGTADCSVRPGWLGNLTGYAEQ